MTKNLYCASVTRGKRTIFKYGEHLKDAIDLLRLKDGEDFIYVKYVHNGKTKVKLVGDILVGR